MRHIVLLISLLLIAASARAWRPPISDIELLGTSDLVVSAVVTKVDKAPDIYNREAYAAVLRVDKVIKGPALPNVTIWYYVQPKYQDNDPESIKLAVEQKNVFFLQRGREGYTPTVADARALRPIGDAAAFQALQATFPCQVTMQGPAGPFFFDRKTTVTVLVKNTGADPLLINPDSVQGFYFSPRLDPPAFRLDRPFLINLRPVQAEVVPTQPQPLQPLQPGGQIGMPQQLTLAPREEKELKLDVACSAPAAWQFLGPESYVQTPAMVRAWVSVTPQPLNADKPQQPYRLCTSPSLTMIGFPPPEEKAAPGWQRAE